jgi:hypothetical protein
MTKSSAARKERSGRKKGKVVPMRQQQGLKLTENERVLFENYHLKFQLIQADAQRAADIVTAKRLELNKAIGERLGIAMDAYQVNLDSGDLTPINGGPTAEPVEVSADGAAQGESKDAGETDKSG